MEFKDQLPEAVNLICASKVFKKALRCAQLLNFLSNRTLDGPHPGDPACRKTGATAADISAEFFPGDEEHSKARILILQTRRKLDEYYGTSSSRDLVRLKIKDRPYALVPQEVSVPERRSRFAKPYGFRRMLLAFCRLQGIGPEERSRRFMQWVNKPNPNSPLHTAAKFKGADDFDAFLQELVKREQQITITDMREVAALYGIHPLLLDTLLSDGTSDPCLQLDLQKDFWDASERGDRFRGRDAVYRIPARRLERADAVIVSLTVKAGGTSDNHEHPGDELMYLLSGSVDVSFEMSGMRSTLSEGDVIHFYAEHKHQVFAHEDSELVIVRFYQIDSLETRQAIWESIEREFANGGRNLPSSHAIAWVREMLPRFRQNKTGAILDILGLARLLQRCTPRPVEVPGVLPENVRKDLEDAREDVIGKISLEAVASTYELEQFLLESFTAPPVPGAITIRKDEWRAMTAALPGGVYYSLPPRNLACSDISLAKVILHGGARTYENQHPGFELLLVLKGTIELQIEGENHKVGKSDCPLCHFNSLRKHTVYNRGNEEAEFLVIRFYRDGVIEPEPQAV